MSLTLTGGTGLRQPPVEIYLVRRSAGSGVNHLTLGRQNRHSISYPHDDKKAPNVADHDSERTPSTSKTTHTRVETEILTVHVERDGRHVSAKWGMHPQLKEELTPEEWKEVTDIMGNVTDVVGTRFSEILAQGQAEAGGTA